MLTKTCKTCKIEFPKNLEYFYKKGEHLGVCYLDAHCKECKSITRKDSDRKYREKNKVSRKQYYEENKCEISDKSKEYRALHKEEIANKKREYREKNKDLISKAKKIYYQEKRSEFLKRNHENYQKNKDEILSQQKKYYENNKEKTHQTNKKYFMKNKTEILDYQKLYRNENKERLSKVQKTWTVKNQIKLLTYRKGYYKTERGKEVSRDNRRKRRSRKLNLVTTFTKDEWLNCLKCFNNACCYCGEKPEILHQEHFVPVTQSGNYTKDNILPACKSCNSSKNNKSFFDWYPKQSFYLKEREDAIVNYISKSSEKLTAQ